jgi:hypothetical protein
MSDFCPDGYLPIADALAQASLYLFPDYFEEFERSAASRSETTAKSGVEQLARALSVPLPPSELWEIARATVDWLRHLLHRGKLIAHYFDRNGRRHSVRQAFWVTAEADGVLESGAYWPFGQPTRPFEERPGYTLFLEQSALQKLLSEEADQKSLLPMARKTDLVEALRKLDHLPNRQAQFDALQALPEFSQFKITVAAFREAARKLPRGPGRKSR